MMVKSTFFEMFETGIALIKSEGSSNSNSQGSVFTSSPFSIFALWSMIPLKQIWISLSLTAALVKGSAIKMKWESEIFDFKELKNKILCMIPNASVHSPKLID